MLRLVAKGDVLNFVMTIEGLTFWETLRKLADQHGIPLPRQSQAGDKKPIRAALYEIHEIAAEHYRANLEGSKGLAVRWLSEPARRYGGRRSAVSTGAFRCLRPHPGSSARAAWIQARSHGALGPVGRRDDGTLYDRFRNRLMFPIHNESGKIIAFGGRALDPEEKAKYLNSPETEIYKKSHILYNLNRAKPSAMQLDRSSGGRLYGRDRRLPGRSHGSRCNLRNGVNDRQIRAMKRHSQNLHLNFDPDTAGAKAAERSVKLLLDEAMRVRVVELEGGLDPDEFCKKHGHELYRARITQAKPYFYWLADRARARFNMRDPQGRNDVFRFLLPAIQGLNDKLERVSVANDLASYQGSNRDLCWSIFARWQPTAPNGRHRFRNPTQPEPRTPFCCRFWLRTAWPPTPNRALD